MYLCDEVMLLAQALYLVINVCVLSEHCDMVCVMSSVCVSILVCVCVHMCAIRNVCPNSTLDPLRLISSWCVCTDHSPV